VAAGLVLHPIPSGGLAEKPSVLSTTPLWGPIHVAIAFGFVLTILGGLLALVAGGALTRRWTGALAWGSLTVGMVFFTGVALVNGYVMHALSLRADSAEGSAIYAAFDDLLLGFGWLGNPLFLFGLSLLAFTEVRSRTIGLPRWAALFGLVFALASWLRGIRVRDRPLRPRAVHPREHPCVHLALVLRAAPRRARQGAGRLEPDRADPSHVALELLQLFAVAAEVAAPERGDRSVVVIERHRVPAVVPKKIGRHVHRDDRADEDEDLHVRLLTCFR